MPSSSIHPKAKTILVFHVCETGADWGQLPNATDTYSKVAALSSDQYEIVFLPQYKKSLNWDEDLAWLGENFRNVPTMLSVFEGGTNSVPDRQLTTGQISDAMAVSNVGWLRLAELVSWYDNNRTAVPVEYLRGIFSFARANNLKVLMGEWQAINSTLQRVKEYIAGFEDVVTIAFQTNSEDLEPVEGFRLVNRMFQHSGASVQAWYWWTHYDLPCEDMPIGLFINHALQARNMGAEVIQFEPYWYLFNNGEPREKLNLLFEMLNK